MKRYLLLASATLAQGAITIDGFTAAANDRFSNHPSFIGSSVDFSGVGRTSSGIGLQNSRAWVTMISPNVFISASHTSPSGTVTFFPGNDPSATPITRSITNTSIQNNSDLIVGTLDHPVPNSIAVYDFENQAITSIAGANVEGENGYLNGLTPTTGASYSDLTSLTNQAVGRNIIDGFFADIEVVGRDTDIITTIYNLPSHTNPPYPSVQTPFESILGGGDSGGPLFVDNGAGGLTLIGINSVVGTIEVVIDDMGNSDPSDDVTDEPRISGFAYVGNYASEINSYLTANPAPEPGTLMFLSLSALALLRRRVL